MARSTYYHYPMKLYRSKHGTHTIELSNAELIALKDALRYANATWGATRRYLLNPGASARKLLADLDKRGFANKYHVGETPQPYSDNSGAPCC